MTAARNTLLKVLHARKRELGIDDDTYRAKLKQAFNVISAKDLDDAQLKRAVDLFHVKQKANFPHTRKVKALWIALANLGAADPADAALDAFVKRQTGKESLNFVTAADAASITEALKDMLAREGFVPKGDARAVRRALLVVQWQKLARIGVVRIDNEWALDSWLDNKFRLCHGGSAAMTEAQLDEAAKALGRWIRGECSKKKASAA